MIRKILSSTIFKLLIAVVIGIVTGLFVNEEFMNLVVTAKYILGQLIFFMVPLIILAFIASSIAKMGQSASKMLGWALSIAYTSSVGAALMAIVLGYTLLPMLTIETVSESVNKLPDLIFKLDIPPVMSVMTALVLSIMVGLSAVWTKSVYIVNILDEFQKMVLVLINKVLIPTLPFFIAMNFCALSYEGAIISQLPIFFNVMVIVLLAHFVWLIILYAIAALFTRKNPMEVVKYYAPPYFTAVGTMSSAATLPVSIKAAKRSKILNDKTVDFSIPLFSNIHLCGSVLTEVFFVMTVSKVLYGTFPEIGRASCRERVLRLV